MSKKLKAVWTSEIAEDLEALRMKWWHRTPKDQKMRYHNSKVIVLEGEIYYLPNYYSQDSFVENRDPPVVFQTLEEFKKENFGAARGLVMNAEECLALGLSAEIEKEINNEIIRDILT